MQITGQLQEIGGGEAVIVQPGTNRVIRVVGLTINECKELGLHLYTDVRLQLKELPDNGGMSGG